MSEYPYHFRQQVLDCYRTMYPVRRFFMRSWWQVVIGNVRRTK